jgi:hypothetical protein
MSKTIICQTIKRSYERTNKQTNTSLLPATVPTQNAPSLGDLDLVLPRHLIQRRTLPLQCLPSGCRPDPSWPMINPFRCEILRVMMRMGEGLGKPLSWTVHCDAEMRASSSALSISLSLCGFFSSESAREKVRVWEGGREGGREKGCRKARMREKDDDEMASNKRLDQQRFGLGGCLNDACIRSIL